MVEGQYVGIDCWATQARITKMRIIYCVKAIVLKNHGALVIDVMFEDQAATRGLSTEKFE